MAESNPTQVILTDDGLKIIKAQNTANEAVGNVNDINSDNKLTPSEKLKLKQEYDKDVELYNIDIEQLKSVKLPTAELETAMSNLTDFVTPLFKEMNRTSTVDRDALDSVFTAFATADKNATQAFVNMVQQVAGDAKKSGDDAKEAGEKAQEAGEEAKASADQAKADAATAQQKIQSSIDNIHLGVKNADGSTSNFNMNGNTILMDTAQTIINGKTSILDASIDTAKIANAAINTAQIADGAINNAKIANASIDDAKINSLNGNKLVENSITANKINVDDLIANGINTKTLTSVNLNTSTLTTPQLDLGFNGTFTEDFDYTQATTMFLPKKNKGTLIFNHGVLQSKGNMQTYVGGQWGGMNSNYNFQAGIDNSQWTEVAPGYIKLDLFRQDDANFVERTYIDPTGYYYKSGNGIASYLGNVLQTSQVQAPSVIGKYIGPSAGVDLLQIGNNGKDYGLRIGNYYGGEGVLSDFIYNTTSSHSPDVHITKNGRLVRTTSASKYKYNIENPDIETTLGDRLLNVRLATWNDKRAVDSYAEQLSTGEEREKSSIDKYYGLIAEQLRDAGLDMFISYGKNHEIEGIQYDRAWIPLLSVIRRLNNKANEYELRLSKLEGVNK